MNSDHFKTRLHVCNVDEEGRFGGPERRIVQVAQALQALDVVTHVVFPKMDSDEFEQQLSEHGIAATKLDITRLSRHSKTLIRYVLRFPLEVGQLISFFNRNRFDVIHVNGSYQFKVAIAGKLAGTPVLWHLNDTFTPNSVKRVFNFLATRCAVGYIVAGERVRRYYLADLGVQGRPVKEIHAPVMLDRFNPARFAGAKAWGESGGIRIGTVSGINPAKGLEYFIEMVAELTKSYPRQKFVIAGARLDSQKSYSAFIEDKIDAFGVRDNIEFVGFVTDIPEFLSQLDICVFTSVTEASPTSVWEALAMEKPVVTTDVGSVSQYIVSGESGFIVPVADVKGLADNVAVLIKAPLLREKLGKAARKVAVEQLSVEAAAAKHKDIYMDVSSAARN